MYARFFRALRPVIAKEIAIPYVATETVVKRTFASALRRSDTYRTMSIECSKCRCELFKYKKKNGTKSKLVKMYTSRIIHDPHDFLTSNTHSGRDGEDCDKFTKSGDGRCDYITSKKNESVRELVCPQCQSEWGRHGTKAGHEIFKCIGGKIRMS
jgi:ssDNA-binding Zn-finger/Zn-ribbon topoisomerase 1